MRHKLLTLSIFTLCSLLGCSGGGGGGGDGFAGAARVSITASPNSIDTRDRTRVTIRIEEVIETGIILKVRFPDKMQYAINTAKLKLDGERDSEELDATIVEENDDQVYLVFFLDRDMFGDFNDDNELSTPATLTFELIGISRFSSSRIEVDADVNDPTIPDKKEFDIEEPAFEPEAEASIEVRESRG